jgi:hypothetical protein
VPVAALITLSGDQPETPQGYPALQRLFGQTLLERQARQLVRAGVGHIVLYAPTLPAALMHAIDRLAALDVSVDLTRTARDAANRVHPEERLIVVEGGLLLADAAINMLATGGGNMILTVPDAADPDRFERIDAQHRWAGALALDGQILRQTAGILGDWDLAPTLLRCAVQQSAERLDLAGDTAHLRLVKPLRVTELNDASRALLAGAEQPTGLFQRWVAAPAAHRLSGLIAATGISHSVLNILSILLYLLSIVAVSISYPWIGFAIFAVAVIVQATASFVRMAVLGKTAWIDRVLGWRGFLLGSEAIVAAARTQQGLGDNSATVFALWFAVQWAAVDQLRSRSAGVPILQFDSGAIALVLALSSAIGGLRFGLAAAVIALILEQFWRQRRMPRP